LHELSPYTISCAQGSSETVHKKTATSAQAPALT
jgi:hypothetical protein